MKIPCAIYRGGTSKPIFFLEKDLPRDPKTRDRVVLAAFGSPDLRQIDGLGGADPLTSKVAYIGPPTVPNTDINYTFGYVGIAQPVIDYTGNCGNTSAAAGPFALLRGLIKPKEPITKVRIYNTNTKKVIVAEFPVRGEEFVSEGDFRIDGAPGSGSKILLDFIDSGGSVTGKLLPTGKVKEEIKFPTVGTLTVSMVDAANPFVFVRGTDLGVQGNETLEEIAGNSVLLKKCEEIRSVVAEIMGIAKKEEATRKSPGVPKIALVSPPTSYQSPKGKVEASEVDIVARMTALQKLHKAYAVTGAVCLGAAAKVEGTIVNEIFRRVQPGNPSAVRIGHPSGTIQVEIGIEKRNGNLELTKAALARTARLLMDGHVYVPDR
ncbi:MAG TPA: 3-methylitaconate isomerase [Deltaproteobacteria bacterium]|nr:MAG: 3-methylitaconate isomerase [Deltaproteobacteria bacterium GWD2_55_8]HBA39425.1 3-methylitaconate isomerase [Deltaproteobacteria bacterium]